MMVKLNTGYSESNTTFYRSFRVVDDVPGIGDDLPGEFGYEIINVEQIALDYSERKLYNAYKVSYIENGFDDERTLLLNTLRLRFRQIPLQKKKFCNN